MYYIGLDVHKKSISYCVKDASGQIHQQGKAGATRWELDMWMKALPQPWTAAMEATIFTGWIYDHLKPHAAGVEANGIRIPFGCRQGDCHTCMTRLLQGNVRVFRDETQDDDLRLQGFVLPCVTRPSNDVTLDA